MPAELTQTTIEVVSDEETFVFRIPSVREFARVGTRSHALRAADSPTTNGSEWGLDPMTADLYRGMALFEVLLERADCKDNWPFTEVDGKPRVDSSKFPPQVTFTVIDVQRRFDEAYRKFLDGWSGNGVKSSKGPVAN